LENSFISIAKPVVEEYRAKVEWMYATGLWSRPVEIEDNDDDEKSSSQVESPSKSSTSSSLSSSQIVPSSSVSSVSKHTKRHIFHRHHHLRRKRIPCPDNTRIKRVLNALQINPKDKIERVVGTAIGFCIFVIVGSFCSVCIFSHLFFFFFLSPSLTSFFFFLLKKN